MMGDTGSHLLLVTDRFLFTGHWPFDAATYDLLSAAMRKMENHGQAV